MKAAVTTGVDGLVGRRFGSCGSTIMFCFLLWGGGGTLIPLYRKLSVIKSRTFVRNLRVVSIGFCESFMPQMNLVKYLRDYNIGSCHNNNIYAQLFECKVIYSIACVNTASYIIST